MKLFKDVIPKEVIDDLFEIYNHSNNQLYTESGFTHRHVMSDFGKCVMSRYTKHELNDVWEKISELFDKPYLLAGGRVMRYGPGDHLPLHQDGGYANNIKSLIVMMNDPSEWVGGETLLDETVVDFTLGDALIYDSEDFHGITEVRQGVRLVANLFVKEIW